MDHPLFNRIVSHSALKQTNEDLRSDLKNAKITVLDLQDKLRKQEHDAVKLAQDENTALQSKLAASESRAEAAATAATTAADVAKKTIEDLRAKLAEATLRSRSLEAEASEATLRSRSLEAAASKAAEEASKVTAAAAEASSAADAANARYEKLSDDTSRAADETAKKIEALEKQYMDTLEKLRETENDLSKVTLEMQSHQSDIENVAEMTKSYEQTKAELEALRLGSQQGAEELREARDDLGKMTVKFGTLSKRHSEVVNEIKGLRVDHDVLVEGVQHTNADLQKALAEKEKTAKRAKFLEELVEDIKVLSDKEDIAAIKSVLSHELDNK